MSQVELLTPKGSETRILDPEDSGDVGEASENVPKMMISGF